MSFSVKRSALGTLKDEADKIKENVEKLKSALGDMETIKGNYAAEQVRRVAQEALDKTESERQDQLTLDDTEAKAIQAQWEAVQKLTRLELADTVKLQLDAKYNKLTIADLDASSALKKATEALTEQDKVTKQKSDDMGTAWTTMADTTKSELKAKYLASNIFDIATVCNDGKDCVHGDTVQEARDTNDAAYGTYKTNDKDWQAKKALYDTEYAKSAALQQIKDIAFIDEAAVTTKYKGKAEGAAALASADKKKAANDAYANAKEATANGQLDIDRNAGDITKQQAAIRRETNNEIVARHMYQLAKDKFDELQAAEDAAKEASTRADAQKLIAETAQTRATTKFGTYKAEYLYVQGLHTQSLADQKALEGSVTTLEAKVKAAEEKQTAAVANCKGVKYKMAQDIYREWKEKQTANKDKAQQIATAYATDSKAPTDGSAGTRCEYPKKGEDGTQKPRPPCADELCCGSANKYLRDGTRLTVETCQAAKGTHTYTFYPKLKSGAITKPRTELWRFYCIEGATKLAATLAAGVGAAYFMA